MNKKIIAMMYIILVLWFLESTQEYIFRLRFVHVKKMVNIKKIYFQVCRFSNYI